MQNNGFTFSNLSIPGMRLDLFLGMQNLLCLRTVLKCKMLLLDLPGLCENTLSLYTQTTGTTVINKKIERR